MESIKNNLEIVARIGRKNMQKGVIFLFMILVFAPIASAGIGGTISGNVYNSNSYTLGQAQVELFNYVGVDTTNTASPIESGLLVETMKTWNTNNPTTSLPSGVPDPSPIFSDTLATNTEPTGLILPTSTQDGDATDTNSAPTGSAGITPQPNDTTSTNIAPLGSAPINSQNANTAATNLAPPGTTATINAQTDDSSATNTPPLGMTASITPQFEDGSATNVKPPGLTDPKPQTSDTTVTFLAPPGSVSITANFADAGSTPVQPPGTAASQSGLWYTGVLIIDADDDGSVDNIIFWVLTDVGVSGVYDTMDLSYDALNYNDGITTDQLVDSGDDERISDGETVTLGTYDFVVNFASNPSAASPDIWITSAEWYTGTFNIDLDGDGTVGAGELVYYALADANSDGNYDVMDISTDDNTFGEGPLANSQTATDDDERIAPGVWVRLATHNFMAGFSNTPFSDNPDAGIWSWEWYTGTLTIDWFPESMANGVLDAGVLMFALSDRDSDGVFDRVDVTETWNNPNFEEGILGDGLAVSGNDEYSTVPGGAVMAMGTYFFNVSFNTAPATSDPDFWIRSNTWYMGIASVEGTAYNVGSSDIDSNGLFDRFYIDLSADSDFNDAGEGPFQTGNTFSDAGLTLDYDVTTIYAAPLWFPTRIAEITPRGATLPSATTDWRVGTINLGGTDYPCASSDYDALPGYEAVEFDLSAPNKELDIMGDDGSDGSPSGFVAGGDIYYCIWVDQNDVRVIPNPWSPALLPTFDYNNDVIQFSGNPVYYYGLIQETLLGELNGDFDFNDEFEVVVVDFNNDATYDACFIDHDDDNNMGNGGGFGPGGSYWPVMPVWPVMGVSLTGVQANGQQITLSVGAVPTASSVTVAQSTPTPLGLSARYIATGLAGSDPASVGMTTPSDLTQNGVATVITPGGITMNGVTLMDSTSTGTQPTGSAPISLNGFDAGSTTTQPTGAPLSTSTLWYFGTLLLDTDGDGSADDIVNWVLTDWFSGAGVYDTISLSYDWSAFNDANVGDGYLGPGDDEWVLVGPGLVQFDTFYFWVSFDSDPTADNDDARITSTIWFEGMFNMDANDDGDGADTVYYVLSDADSNGVYDTMDISCEDLDYAEAGGSPFDGYVNYLGPGNNDNDERITATSDVTLGNSFLFTVSFDGGPLLDVDDARIQSKEWYEGTFTIDADDDGTADDPVNFALSDMNSDGLYDTMDLSLDDTTFEEGPLGDSSVADPNNDERIQTVIQDNFDGVSMGAPTWDNPPGTLPWPEWNRMSTNPFSPIGPLQNPVNEYYSGTDSFWCGAPNVNDPAAWPPGSTPPGVGTDWDEELKLLAVDLTSSSTATLSFNHYYNFDDVDFDGGNVHISTTSQFGPWTLLIPAGGYDGTLSPFASSGEEAYTGTNSVWTTARFDLSAYTGNTIWLRWRTVTSWDAVDDEDGGADGDGWFIDDVMIQADRHVTIGPSFEFLVEFDIAPNIDPADVRIFSNEWYEGTFLIDGNGNGFALEIVRYVLTDTDSDGVYEAMDISIDDTMYGEGNINDNVVDWSGGGNDERITTSWDITLGVYYLFTCDFDGGPNVDADDARITSKEWYEGAFIIDSDGDSLAAEKIYFVLTDTDSEGLYEAMDLSMNTTYGEGDVNDLIVDSSGAGNDERVTVSTALTLGDHYLFMTGFDAGPNMDLVDARIRSEEWYEGSFSIDGDDDGVANEVVDYVLSDTNSDGLYDTIDMSIDDIIPVYGEGALNDVIVDWSGIGNDERVSIVIMDQFDGTPIGNPWWVTAVGASGFVEWNLDSTQGQFSSGVTSYWCGAPNVNDPAAWPPGSTPPGYGLSWDEILRLVMVNLFTANDAVLTFDHYYDLEKGGDGGAVYISTTGPFGPWTLLDPVGGYDGLVMAMGNDGYTGDSGGWSTATFDLTPYVGNFIHLRWRMTENGTSCDEDGGWDGYGWFIDDVTVLADRYITLGTSYEFIVEFDIAPHTDLDDARITSNEWYGGDLTIDADDVNDDGFPDDSMNYALTDTDSDGIYDTMDISINDDVYGETGAGGLSDEIVDYDTDVNNLDDERITATTNVTLGDSLLFTVEFDPNPNNPDNNDVRILSVEWYEGTFSIDLDGDGTVDPDSVNFVLSDVSSMGIHLPFMDISTDDNTYGEGDLLDQVTGIDNDEGIWFLGGELVTMGAYTYHVQSFDQLFDGLDVNDGVNYDGRDVRITINHWFWGSALLEENTRYAVVGDSDSDGIFDEVYIDVNDNGDWGDVGVDAIGVPVSGTFQGSLLELQYTVTYIDPQGQYFEIQPTGASVDLTTSWFVGQIEAPTASANWYDVVLSDTDDDTIFETADFDSDLPGDSIVDVLGLTETVGLVPLTGMLYQMINIQDFGQNVRIISYIDAMLGPANDISLSDTIHHGLVSEAALTLNLNQDGDITDIYHTIVVDNMFWGLYQTVFIDTDNDYDLSSESTLVVGSVFTIQSLPPMEAHQFDIDFVNPTGDNYAFKQINHPVDTYITDSAGYYSLDAAIDGDYWIKVSNSGASWGYGIVSDTNMGAGISITDGDTIENWDEYLPQTGNFIFGYVNDSVSTNPLNGVVVEVYDSTGSLVVSTLTKADGAYQLAVAPGPDYDIVYSYPGYYTDDGRTTGTWQDMLIVTDTYSRDVLLVPDTIPPTITIDYPFEGQTVSGIRTITVTAIDDFLLESVEVSFDYGATYYPMTPAGGNSFIYWWDTTSHSEGLCRVTVRAIDTSGFSDSQFVDVYVSNDATPPSVSIVSPSDNDYTDGTYIIQVLASDNYALEFVNITIDATTFQATYNAISGYYEHPLDTTLFSDGLHTLSVRATDYGGNFAIDILVTGVNIDNTPPTLWINTPSEGETVYGSTVSLDCDSVDNGVTYIPTVEYRIDSGSWFSLAGSEILGWTASWDSNTVSNGIHTIFFRSYDTIGHVTSESILVTVDNDYPTAQVVAPVASEYVQGMYTFHVLATDDIQVASVHITINGIDYDMAYNSHSGFWEVTIDSTTIADEAYDVYATVWDGVPGHTDVSALVGFYIDNTAPTLAIIAPSYGDTVFGSTVNIDVDSQDPGSFNPTVSYRIDSGDWTDLTGSEILGWTGTWNSNDVSNGIHTIYFRSTDDAGHITTDSITVTVDNDNPTVIVVAPLVSEYIQGTYTFKVAASDALGVTNVYVTINGIDYTAGYNSVSGFWEVEIETNTISDGTYGITATAEDGILSHTQTTASFDFNIDNNAPLLSINSPFEDSIVFGISVPIDVNATDDGIFEPTVQYRIDKGAWIDLLGSEILGWADSWDSTTVSYGMHTIHFRAYDAIGHIVTDNVKVTVDNDNPQVAIITPLVNEFIQGTYTFRVVASDAISVTNVYITINGIDYTAGYNSVSGFWEVDIDSTTIPDGTYGITATAEDGILSHTQTSSSYNFNVDNNAPTLSINSPSSGQTVFGNMLSIDVTSSDAGVFVPTVRYRIGHKAWITLSGSEVAGWTDSYDTTTVQNGVHTLTIISYDTMGHVVTESIDITVDNDNPIISLVAPLQGEYAQKAYSFCVSATDDIGVTNVYITIDGKDYATGYNSASGYWEVVIDTTTLLDGTYSITATAEDGIPGHTQTTVLTDFNIDNNAPSISINLPSPGQHLRGDIVFDVLGNDTFLDRVEYNVDGTGWVSIGTSWNSAGFIDGAHTLSFRAIDLAGHITEETITVVVDNADLDDDGIGDLADLDIDGDGVYNEFDAFPHDISEWIDTDSDGIGNNIDTDDDGDNIPDVQDAFSLNSFEYLDTDIDGIGDNIDIDDDGDLIPDINDAFPLDASETVDLDKDGIGDNSDPDIDGDGFQNTNDAFPANPHEWNDNDADGIGDNADPDDDNDGVTDLNDYAPMDKSVQMEPFWWWWILFAVLIIVFTVVTFITNRPRTDKLPEEEKAVPKHHEEYEDLKEELPPKPAPKDIEEIPSYITKPTPSVYTTSVLESMKKSQLIEVAKQMGLDTMGTKSELIKQINIAQADSSMEEIIETLKDFDCSSCGKVIKAKSSDLPSEITCPHCGNLETIK
jgi:hypothetical protein